MTTPCPLQSSRLVLDLEFLRSAKGFGLSAFPSPVVVLQRFPHHPEGPNHDLQPRPLLQSLPHAPHLVHS